VKKKLIYVLILCSLMILGSVSTTIPSVIARNTPDWPDGTFQGIWKNQKDGDTGFLMGSLNQGRRATRGIFSGDWNTTDGTENGTMKGVFQGVLLAGQWMTAGESSSKMIGILQLNDTDFSARVFVSGTGMIVLSGTHDTSFLPKLTGSYGIGVRSMHLVDESRPENFTAWNTTDVREMMIQVWYPTQMISEGTRTEYMDYPTFQWLKGRSPIPLVSIPNDAYLFVRPHGYNESSIAEGMFPVIVFSPGYDGVYQIYTSFIEDLVSHGFVVVSMNHPYVSGITVFPDGRTVGLSAVPTDPVERSAFFNMSLRTIVGDAKFTLDTMTEMNATDPEFSDHFDLSHVGMYGHSFGGANTAVCCYEDARFKAGLTLDGVFYQQFTPGNITVPFLYIFAENRLANDTTVGYMWNHTTGDTFKMSITGSTHYAFTDVGVLLSHLVPLIPPRLLSFGSIPPKRMVNITRTSVTAFFQVTLKGAPLEYILTLPDLYDEVQLEYKLR
jgi:dienelactone hydrolase